MMTVITSVSGKLSKKDLKQLTGATRKVTVGPTTVYYAGVTDPIISAGVAVFARNLLQRADYISDYWLFFISTLIAAFAGICWYLIFMRWSYRNRHGRGDEINAEGQVEITQDALIVSRNHVTTRIGWAGVSEVQRQKGRLTILVDAGHAILIPDSWFGGDIAARDNFHSILFSHAKN